MLVVFFKLHFCSTDYVVAWLGKFFTSSDNTSSSQTHLYFSQFFGEPIACDAGEANGGIERAVLDAYCWMYSSWNIPQEYKGACTGGDQVMTVTWG